ncbi:Sodium Bile acid symporter family protein [Posidoniimonas polymericola]|uniref:Sodium Bile acid symporter family protein n=1 Tax=Posidoniimonas polymericola TaxID=2528002 RepID=A0A5C5ZGK3_9BACT|nr:bile acid:sodium symporter family protein [Posidoniimonas polymericola]TWT86001.1 Sodium Bile acid symporter family protein [Posidoniimonas polymericola]
MIEGIGKLERAALLVCPAALAVALVGVGLGQTAIAKNAAVAGFLALALGIGAVSTLRTFRFTAWVTAAVAAALAYPTLFQPFGVGTPSDKLLLLVLIQAVMFGMGTQITLADFAGVARQPWPVAVGLICQFTIMPLVGYTLAVAFRLPPEIGAGMVLIGSCSSGLSSNVMAYIARANLALSITMTAVATLLAPLLTPMWMNLLAAEMLEGSAVPMSFLGLMAAIIKIVIVPTGAALIHDYLRFASTPGRLALYAVAAVGAVVVAAANLGGWAWAMADAGEDAAMWGELALFLLGGVTFGVLYHHTAIRVAAVDRAMPAVAMAGIVYVTGMTSAAGRDALMVVGLALCLAAALHNLIGYVLGYWLSRLCGLDRASCRTVAFEVGLQNGGMATGLASAMGKLGTLGLPAAFFIAWMNVSGSLLANFWRRRPVDRRPEEEVAPPTHDDTK